MPIMPFRHALPLLRAAAPIFDTLMPFLLSIVLCR